MGSQVLVLSLLSGSSNNGNLPFLSSSNTGSLCPSLQALQVYFGSRATIICLLWLRNSQSSFLQNSLPILNTGFFPKKNWLFYIGWEISYVCTQVCLIDWLYHPTHFLAKDWVIQLGLFLDVATPFLSKNNKHTMVLVSQMSKIQIT